MEKSIAHRADIQVGDGGWGEELEEMVVEWKRRVPV